MCVLLEICNFWNWNCPSTQGSQLDIRRHKADSKVDPVFDCDLSVISNIYDKLWDVITYPCPIYLLLTSQSSYNLAVLMTLPKGHWNQSTSKLSLKPKTAPVVKYLPLQYSYATWASWYQGARPPPFFLLFPFFSSFSRYFLFFPFFLLKPPINSSFLRNAKKKRKSVLLKTWCIYHITCASW